MIPFRVIAIDNTFATQVRLQLRDPDYGHPAHVEAASGYGPCRQCLRDFKVGEERRILLTYNAFRNQGEIPLPGPVFIHEQECQVYDPTSGFPKQGTRAHTLQAYRKGREQRSETLVEHDEVDDVLQCLLADEEVAYIHVRDASAGCYDFRIERAN